MILEDKELLVIADHLLVISGMSSILWPESVVWGENSAVQATDQTKINTLSELAA